MNRKQTNQNNLISCKGCKQKILETEAYYTKGEKGGFCAECWA